MTMETIKKLRETMGIKSAHLSELMNVNAVHYSVIEKETRNPRKRKTLLLFKIKALEGLLSHIQTMKQLEPEILTAIENLKNEIK